MNPANMMNIGQGRLYMDGQEAVGFAEGVAEITLKEEPKSEEYSALRYGGISGSMTVTISAESRARLEFYHKFYSQFAYVKDIRLPGGMLARMRESYLKLQEYK